MTTSPTGGSRGLRPDRGFGSLHVSLLGVLALLAGSPVPAQLTPPLEENVVVTATLSPEEESQLGAATTVIDRLRIEASGAATVQELLRLVPGVDVVRGGEDGSLVSLFLRGANSTHALVLVNGVRVNSPYFSGYDFSALTPEAVERIEVVRGPFSSLYGSDAVGGVVQIFTRAAAPTPTVHAALEAGGDDLRNGSFFVSSGEGPLALTASGRLASVEGTRTNSDWKERNATLRVEGKVGATARAALEASILDGEAGVPGPVGAETVNARGTLREERVALPVSFAPLLGHEATFLFGYVRSTPTYRNPDDPYSGLSDTDARTLQARVTDTWRLGRQRLTAFASWEQSSVTASDAFGPFLEDDGATMWGAGLQDSFDLAERVHATVGIRLDRHGDFGSAVSPRIAAAWLSRDCLWKIRISAGSAFRAPSVGELYFPYVGNPELQPERSRSYEVGAERYVKAGRAEVSWFWNDFRDLILYDFSTQRNENIGRARTRGVEVGWRQQVATALAVDAGYTWLEAEDRRSGERLLRRPQHRGYFGAYIRVSQHLRGTLRATWVGERPDVSGTTFQPVTNPAYLRVDVSTQYDLGWVRPYVRIENVTDEDYAEADGFPAPGLRACAGVEFRVSGKTKRS